MALETNFDEEFMSLKYKKIVSLKLHCKSERKGEN
jgi:hypothetical protein